MKEFIFVIMLFSFFLAAKAPPTLTTQSPDSQDDHTSAPTQQPNQGALETSQRNNETQSSTVQRVSPHLGSLPDGLETSQGSNETLSSTVQRVLPHVGSLPDGFGNAPYRGGRGRVFRRTSLLRSGIREMIKIRLSRHRNDLKTNVRFSDIIKNLKVKVNRKRKGIYRGVIDFTALGGPLPTPDTTDIEDDIPEVIGPDIACPFQGTADVDFAVEVADVNECMLESQRNISCDQRCVNTNGSYRCECNAFSFSFADDTQQCNDADECRYPQVHQCDFSCHNTVGGFFCRCPQGTKVSANGHDCLGNICRQNYRNIFGGKYCTGCKDIYSNSSARYECTACKDGFELSPDKQSCTDTDECEKNNGGCPQLCTNIIGSVHCHCALGYSHMKVSHGGFMTELCIDIDECGEDNGNCSDKCLNTNGSFICVNCTGPQAAEYPEICTECNSDDYDNERELHCTTHEFQLISTSDSCGTWYRCFPSKDVGRTESTQHDQTEAGCEEQQCRNGTCPKGYGRIEYSPKTCCPWFKCSNTISSDSSDGVPLGSGMQDGHVEPSPQAPEWASALALSNRRDFIQLNFNAVTNGNPSESGNKYRLLVSVNHSAYTKTAEFPTSTSPIVLWYPVKEGTEYRVRFQHSQHNASTPSRPIKVVTSAGSVPENSEANDDNITCFSNSTFAFCGYGEQLTPSAATRSGRMCSYFRCSPPIGEWDWTPSPQGNDNNHKPTQDCFPSLECKNTFNCPQGYHLEIMLPKFLHCCQWFRCIKLNPEVVNEVRGEGG